MSKQSRFSPKSIFIILIALMYSTFAPVLAIKTVPSGLEPTLRITGSATLTGLMSEFLEHLKKNHPELISSVIPNSSRIGIDKLIQGRYDVALTNRQMTQEEFVKAVNAQVLPVHHLIARSAVCIIVHPKNPVKSLSIDQLKNIYEGRITNWQTLGGQNQAISVFNQTYTGSTDILKRLISNKIPEDKSVMTQIPSPGMMTSNEGAIAYIGPSMVGSWCKAVAIDEFEPTKENIRTGRYPLCSNVYLITNGYPNAGTILDEFITYHFRREGQNAIATLGFNPLTDY